MPDPILITTLVATLVGGVINLIQSYLDYKRDRLNNNHDLYEMRNYQSSCCNIITESDSDNNQNTN